MTSREIAELTEKEHGHVCRDIASMLSDLSEKPMGYLHPWIHPQNKQTYYEYWLDRELTETLLTGYSAVLRRKVVARWRELESAIEKPRELSTLDILEMATTAERARLVAVEQLAIAAPKVEFVDRYVDATGLKGFRQVAKLLSIKEPEFRAFLSDHAVMYLLGGEWHAYQNHIDAGRFSEKTGVNEVSGHAFNACKFTPKGIAWIAGLIASKRVSNDLDGDM